MDVGLSSRRIIALVMLREHRLQHATSCHDSMPAPGHPQALTLSCTQYTCDLAIMWTRTALDLDYFLTAFDQTFNYRFGFAVRLASSLAVGILYDYRIQNWDLSLGARWVFSLTSTILYFSLGAHVILLSWASVCSIFNAHQEVISSRRWVLMGTAGCLCLHGFLFILAIIGDAELYMDLFAGDTSYQWTDKLPDEIYPAAFLFSDPSYAPNFYYIMMVVVFVNSVFLRRDNTPGHSNLWMRARACLARPDPLLVFGYSAVWGTCAIAQGLAALQNDPEPAERRSRQFLGVFGMRNAEQNEPASQDSEPLLPSLATGVDGDDAVAVPEHGLRMQGGMQVIESIPILAVQVLAVTVAAGTCVGVTWVEWLSVSCSLLNFIFLAHFNSIGEAYIWGSACFVGMQDCLQG